MQSPSLNELKEFSLNDLAPNGLRRGRTTGSCATAAVKAALTLMLRGEHCAQVAITLPNGQHYLVIPIQSVQWLDAQSVRAEVLKDGGDDPDNTHGATIFAEVRKNKVNEIRFFAGQGVGTATQPGLRVAVGEPAINPVPRWMMRQAVAEVLGNELPVGFDLIIGCENGKTIAKKTFNPRLGIVGGISILGTSGIVEPLSLASWIASIEVYVRVALGGGAPSIAFLPGKIGRTYSKETLGLPTHRAVQIANFLGDALDFMQRALIEEKRKLDTLWLLGHPGKLAKVLAGVWDTHSSKSDMAMAVVADVACDLGFTDALVQIIAQANTVEAIVDLLKYDTNAPMLWQEIERRIAALVHERTSKVSRVEVRLFSLNGTALGSA
ncbi:cobalt-precorrin-5B (C(1))-methyltransferase CbiD [Methylicorpusculum sp.]|uniref:cobalt-precorrin-5B (C(1))-methyltransferase CbiD n=1 Tax=Methylicorpusculum sp. TaxID=2713644 RepID=UPI002ABA0276|nr:cobalt-precorrin-5B (C(1))-methyltransferase CbiD [Methylicorpusculum sp.]MDZ4151109.1 cobalt-precorrin-5B (C(1))-methyltransferase CbiD [Methylicorpusculum sp.]